MAARPQHAPRVGCGPRVGLTRKQHAVFAFVEAEIRADRPAPSFAEIQVQLGLSSRSAVHRLVCALVERGWLVRLPHRARSLALPEAARARDLAPAGAVPDAALAIDLPATLAQRLALFCTERRRSRADVVREALDAHLRWPS